MIQDNFMNKIKGLSMDKLKMRVEQEFQRETIRHLAHKNGRLSQKKIGIQVAHCDSMRFE